MNRVEEIDEEMKWLDKRRSDLLAERSRLLSRSSHLGASGKATYWVDPVYAIIESYASGVSRMEIVVALGNDPTRPEIDNQVLTNTLSTLRRRGWIVNHGTKKRPEWHALGKTPRSEWNARNARVGVA